MQNTHPAVIPYLSNSLDLIGLAILVAALAPLRRLIAMLPAGSLRHKWLAMTGLIFIFIAGYLGYIIVLWGKQTEWQELPIPGIFLFGAIFVRLTIALSLQTGAAIWRIDLFESESITDPLTKVYNRRHMERRLDEEVARAKRYSLELSILMIDIDYFKRVNDTYGHQAGDVTLSTLGSLVKTTLRDLDVVARYGGEEFLVICTNTAIDGAVFLAERLRLLVASHQIKVADASVEKQTIQITISIGVASFSTGVDSKKSCFKPQTKRYTAQKEKAEIESLLLQP